MVEHLLPVEQLRSNELWPIWIPRVKLSTVKLIAILNTRRSNLINKLNLHRWVGCTEARDHRPSDIFQNLNTERSVFESLFDLFIDVKNNEWHNLVSGSRDCLVGIKMNTHLYQKGVSVFENIWGVIVFPVSCSMKKFPGGSNPRPSAY